MNRGTTRGQVVDSPKATKLPGIDVSQGASRKKKMRLERTFRVFFCRFEPLSVNRSWLQKKKMCLLVRWPFGCHKLSFFFTIIAPHLVTKCPVAVVFTVGIKVGETRIEVR